MRRLLTVLLAIGLGFGIAGTARAQQAPGPQRHEARLLAVNSRSADNSADLNLIVTPTEQFYPGSTLRSPVFLNTERYESGIMGAPSPDVGRENLLRSLFPIDDADASNTLGIYAQANF